MFYSSQLRTTFKSTYNMLILNPEESIATHFECHGLFQYCTWIEFHIEHSLSGNPGNVLDSSLATTMDPHFIDRRVFEHSPALQTEMRCIYYNILKHPNFNTCILKTELQVIHLISSKILIYVNCTYNFLFFCIYYFFRILHRISTKYEEI